MSAVTVEPLEMAEQPVVRLRNRNELKLSVPLVPFARLPEGILAELPYKVLPLIKMPLVCGSCLWRLASMPENFCLDWIIICEIEDSLDSLLQLVQGVFP